VLAAPDIPVFRVDAPQASGKIEQLRVIFGLHEGYVLILQDCRSESAGTVE
jgi:hypothetical protein